jgi:hypothetical protein
MTKTVDYKEIHRVAAAVVGSNAECCADVVLSNLRAAARELVPPPKRGTRAVIDALACTIQASPTEGDTSWRSIGARCLR